MWCFGRMVSRKEHYTMNKSLLMRNAHTSTMAATAALAAAIGAATTAMASDYPVLSSTGTTGGTVGVDYETFFDRVENWTAADPGITVVAPSNELASAFEYVLTNALNGPIKPLNVFHSRKFTITTKTWQENRTGTVVVTNRFENEGLVIGDQGGFTAANKGGYYGDVTYEGKIVIDARTSPSSYAAVMNAGKSDGVDKANILRLAGTLHGTGRLSTKSQTKGARVVIEAEAVDFTGLMNPNQASGWTTFGCSVFNGTVAPWNGTAIGAERATSRVSINILNINSDGIVLIVPFSDDGSSAGCLTVTNSFTQEATAGSIGVIKVQLRGGIPQIGTYPVLRLAAGCSGAFDQSKIDFDSDRFVNDVRVAQTVPAKVSDTIRLAVKTEGDGSRILCVERVPAATVISMR